MRKRNLPKVVYVSRSGSHFLSATEKWEHQAEIGETKRVGVYRLERVIEVTAESKVAKDSGVKRR